jgi:hypothetical protein
LLVHISDLTREDLEAFSRAPVTIRRRSLDSAKVSAPETVVITARKFTKGQRRTMLRGTERKLVTLEEQQAHELAGWTMLRVGRKPSATSYVPKRTAMHRGDDNILVEHDKVPEYLAQGWSMGRLKSRGRRLG